MYTRKVDGLLDRGLLEPNFSVELAEPFCVEIEALDLASGTITTSGRQCFGEDVADQLGPKEIDPPETLTCGLQICEPTESSWDLKRCTPHGPQPDEAAGLGETGGCGCMSGTPGEAGLLVLLGLVGLARRHPSRGPQRCRPPGSRSAGPRRPPEAACGQSSV